MIWMSASAREQPSTSLMLPAAVRLANASVYRRLADSRSPTVQCASPTNAAALPWRRWSDGSARSSARLACSIVALGIPGDERERGAVHLHLRREVGELGVIEHDRRRRVDGRVEPSVDALQERLDPGDLTADHERTDQLDAQHRSGREELVRQRREPPASGRLLPGPEHDRRRQLDEPCGPLDVVAGHRVGDRLGPIARRPRTSRSPADGARRLARAARPAFAPGARRRRGGGSGTRGGDRRAGRGRGSPDRAARASPSHRCHRSPHRTEPR